MLSNKIAGQENAFRCAKLVNQSERELTKQVTGLIVACIRKVAVARHSQLMALMAFVFTGY